VRRRRAARRSFFGTDRYAAFALGVYHEVGSSFADSDIYVAKRGVSESVIPDIDEAVLRIECDSPEVARSVEEVLLDRHSYRELWVQPSFPMELGSYVGELIDHGEIFVRYVFGRADDKSPFALVATEWLAPETVQRRHRNGQAVSEQYASRRAHVGADYIIVDEPQEYLCEFDGEEILDLRWPFGEGGRSPAQAALEVGREVARHAEHSLLAARANVEDDPFLPLARARSGAFAEALDAQKVASARIKDMLFYPGAYEAEAFPWAPEIAEYFAADRIIRSRIAICRLRQYLFREFNRQVMERWQRLNDWPLVRLGLRPTLFSEEDWSGLPPVRWTRGD
jgi:hypothetical protein